MLSNELLGFIRRQFQGLAEVSADSAGDDVFTWNVEIWRSAFKPDCPMAKVCWQQQALTAGRCCQDCTIVVLCSCVSA